MISPQRSPTFLLDGQLSLPDSILNQPKLRMNIQNAQTCENEEEYEEEDNENEEELQDMIEFQSFIKVSFHFFL